MMDLLRHLSDQLNIDRKSYVPYNGISFLCHSFYDRLIQEIERRVHQEWNIQLD
jgi:hypothetical protein